MILLTAPEIALVRGLLHQLEISTTPPASEDGRALVAAYHTLAAKAEAYGLRVAELRQLWPPRRPVA